MATIILNIYTYFFQDGYIYLNLTILVTQFMNIFKMLAVRQCIFFEENLVSWHPKTHGPRNYLQSFYLASLIHKCREKYIYIYLLRFEILLQVEGQDHFINKMITMELLRRL